jgi:hypothetical protein
MTGGMSYKSHNEYWVGFYKEVTLEVNIHILHYFFLRMTDIFSWWNAAEHPKGQTKIALPGGTLIKSTWRSKMSWKNFVGS